ncbi:YdeI/OmpD-associated family protein [Nonomuraea sp. NBC_01738]|uniref:YdeI/OmpD-associated family protein n=1 Tax=Nonomuraea sp. NBC_01738 TaxID=2976003 RepID=UPI002E0F6AB9|nr:YdeI/OmpD-associated family protein [Nonomuraea sp. NBC_01738]
MEEPILDYPDLAAWEKWLEAHHGGPTAAWLRIAKKSSGIASIGPAEAIEVALCFGWIDSQRRKGDDTSYLQRYSRRRPGGSWSKVNVERVERLIADGRMREAGMAEILAAQADGRWDGAYESQAVATTPPDLEAALAANDRARTAFDALDRTGRYLLILQLLKARTDRTRETRLAKMIAELAG